jgi:hypothetical protein
VHVNCLFGYRCLDALLRFDASVEKMLVPFRFRRRRQSLGRRADKSASLLSRGVAVEYVADLTARQVQLLIAQQVKIRVTESPHSTKSHRTGGTL